MADVADSHAEYHASENIKGESIFHLSPSKDGAFWVGATAARSGAGKGTADSAALLYLDGILGKLEKR
jgi:hypothetical protein